MTARDDLYAFGMSGKYHSLDNSERMSARIDAYRDEVLRELIHKMRRQVAAGLKMPVFATVVVLGGSAEPMGVTHILDAWDPDQQGMRPAREALAELREWEP